MIFGKLGWANAVDESDQWDGFNEPGMEHFLGNPTFHLAKEINQNALDAAEDGLVKVSFIAKQIDTKSIPNLDEFKEIITACLQSSENESEKARLFFEKAVKLLEKKQIDILEISDSNTSGIKGPAINGTPYYAFMKASGQSKKDSPIAAGSYGIGKFAPYTVSSLRTIFVSTVYAEKDGKWSQLTQGKCILMSHYDKKGKLKRGVGFWGIREKCQPVLGILPKSTGWLQRVANQEDFPTKKGTTISVLGFEGEKNWRELLAAYVAENFFGAISNKKLEVNIDNKIVLSQDTISGIFENSEINKVIETQKDEPERFNNCKAYLSAIQNSDEVQIEETEARYLGRCNMRILVGENLPKKVCILRNGMLITDELSGLRLFSDFKEFAAVIECKSIKGNQLLREMEPPRHDDFQPDRLPIEKRTIGKRALSDLAKWAREALKKHAKDPVSDITALDELKDFFGDELSDGNGKGSEEINPVGEIIIRARPLPRKLLSSDLSDIDLEQIGTDGGGFQPVGGESIEDLPGISEGGTISGRGEGSGEGEGGSGNLGKAGIGTDGRRDKAIYKLQNIKAVMKGANSRRIFFTPIATGEIRLQIMGAGADTDHKIDVVKSSEGYIQDGQVIMNVISGRRTNLDIVLGKNFEGSVKVTAYEV